MNKPVCYECYKQNNSVQNARKTGDDSDICPRCGEKLVLRVGKKGKYENKQFMGCSAFPKCRYIGKVIGEVE
jgi:ssDNA-binding Zn-finger/Zn-ribbon topoisomerase 1